MTLSQWGREREEFDEVDMAWLTVAYLRRVQMEARIHAVALINAWGEVYSDGSNRRIAPEAMIMQMGGFH